MWNGFGKSQGLVQVEELGTLETPIASTNTLNVGKVHDAMVSVMLDWCRRDGVKLAGVNPVVLECNDSGVSDTARRPVGEAEVRAAIAAASADFAEGDVGAGRGAICYGMKGGIGSASRQMTLGDETFTLGVLVQSNYGASADFQWAQLPQGLAECDRGSIIMVVATGSAPEPPATQAGHQAGQRGHGAPGFLRGPRQRGDYGGIHHRSPGGFRRL